MRRSKNFLIAIAILFLTGLAAPARGQTPITVTATITDASGLPYSNANVQTQLIPTGGTPTIVIGGIPRQVGGQFNATTDVNGSFTMNLFCNQSGNGCSVITAGGANNTQWQFTVQETGIQPPAGTGPQTFSVTVTLSGASGLSQSLSTTLSAAAPALGRGSGGAATAGPIMATYLTNACQTSNILQCFFTQADSLEFNDCAWSNAATDVNCTGSHFTAADVSKNAMGALSCADDNQGAGTGGQIATTTAVTIASFISGTHITLSATPANAVVSNGCFIYGHLDDAGASSVDTAMQASNTCPKLFLAASNYFFSSPHWFTNPPACAALGPGFGSFGSTTLPAGFELEGRGVGPTTLWMNTNFPNGDACTHKATPSQISGGCWAIPLMGKWSDFRLDGGGQHAAPNLNNKNLLSMAVGTLQNFTCTNMGWLGGGQVGMNLGVLSQLYQVNNAGCGNTAIATEVNATGTVIFRTVTENSTVGLSLSSGSEVTCYWCVLAVQNNSANFTSVLNVGGKLKMFGGRILSGNTGATASVGICYKDTGAGLLVADGVEVGCNAGGAGNGAVWVSVAGGKVVASNGTQLNGQAAGFAYADTAGGTLVIDPSVTFTQQFSNGSIVGQVVADGHSLTGIGTGVCTASSTLGLRITGTSTTGTGIPSTCTSATLDAGVQMTANRTVSNLRCTSSATTVSVACTVLVNGVASALTCTMTAATSCNDFSHTVAVNVGDLISEKIVTGAAETGANIKAFAMWQ